MQVGGEHEDHYDPDFYIFNDVVVHDGKGAFQICAYPSDVFPPTDFHTATLVGDSIYIIGCLGYPEQREEGQTPVYRLELETWKVEAVTTCGETPSWLHEHRSTFDAQWNAIHVEGGNLISADNGNGLQIIPNEAPYELDLSSFQWRRRACSWR